jgi:hypothetical protein
MTDVALFHSVYGLRPAVAEAAEMLRAAERPRTAGLLLLHGIGGEPRGRGERSGRAGALLGPGGPSA